jgi:hypothetical protein
MLMLLLSFTALYFRSVIFPPSEPSLLTLQAKTAAARAEAHRARKQAAHQATAAAAEGDAESSDPLDLRDKKIQ